MTSFDGLLMTLIFIGGLLYIVSFVIIRNGKKHIEENAEDNGIDEDFVYEEVRNKILELNEYGEYLKTELDGKHKELLFLYQMINEKEKEIRRTDSTPERLEEPEDLKSSQNVNLNAVSQKEIEAYKEIHYNKKILDLSLAGYSNQEIAKRLNIGTGQVELVLNLFK
jgi:hypothetical protein